MMGGVEILHHAGDEGYWAMLLRLMDDEVVRGIIAGGLIAVLSIPKAMIGQLLRRIPEQYLRPESIPPILAMMGLFMGAAIGHWTPLPVDLSIAVGTGAGWASGAAHDRYVQRKPSRGK